MSPEYRIAPIWRLREFRYRLVGCCSPSKWQGLAHFAEGGRSDEGLSRKGVVVSWTRRRDGVVVALVEVTDDQGNKEGLTAQLTDLKEDPKIGMLVEMVTRKLEDEGDKSDESDGRGLIIYGYKFRPVIDHEEE